MEKTYKLDDGDLNRRIEANIRNDMKAAEAARAAAKTKKVEKPSTKKK